MFCLICDDHALIRDALSMTLANAYPEARVDVASDFIAGWALAEEKPDLIICDLGMPGSAAEPGIARLRELAPDARMIILTGIEDDETLLSILSLGVHGFVTKSTDHGIFEAAMKLVMAGGTYYPPRLLALSQGARPEKRVSVEAELGKLSTRQIDVLKLLMQGQSNKEIARELDISPATVKTHVAHIIACLGATNRTEAAMKARELGIV